jgi:hypothetical protein
MRVSRAFALAFSLVICSLFAFSSAHAQISIGISVDVEPPPLPVYDQPPIPTPGYLWVPGYWHGTTTLVITGYPAPGSRPRNLSCFGRPAIGAGTTAPINSTTDIGDGRSDFMAASLTALAIPAMVTREDTAERQFLLQPVGQQHLERVDHQRLQQDRCREQYE